MVKVHMDSNWTVQSSGLQWTPVHFSHRQSRYKLAVKKVDWSPVESSGVHIEYGGDCKDLSRCLSPSFGTIPISESAPESDHGIWAEDAKSLPTIHLPPSLYPPRDLSVLLSSSSSPFSSLQHCSKCFTHYFHQSHHCHSHFNFNPFYSSHLNDLDLIFILKHILTLTRI